MQLEPIKCDITQENLNSTTASLFPASECVLETKGLVKISQIRLCQEIYFSVETRTNQSALQHQLQNVCRLIKGAEMSCD